jgi:hypothetical protein
MEFFYSPQLISNSPVNHKPEPRKIPEIKHICPKTNKVIGVEEIEYKGKNLYVSTYKSKNKKPVIKKMKMEPVSLGSGKLITVLKRFK